MNAQSLDDDWDVIIVHDPQPAALKSNAPDRARIWIWRCHIDLSTPNAETLARLLPLLREYDETVWHLQQYVPAGLDGSDADHPARDRPAVAEEHGALPGGRGLRLQAVRDRRRAPADLPGLALRSLEGPDRGDRRVPAGAEGDAGGAAGAGRLDGHRRPRGLGVLPRDVQLRGRRSRHQDPQQPQQRRGDRGQRVPVAGRRGDAEVAAGGVRAHCHRGALEGTGDGGRQRGRDPAPDRRRRDRLFDHVCRRGRRPRPAHTPGSGARQATGPRREGARAGALLDARGCCATGFASSGTSSFEPEAGDRLEPRARGVRPRSGRGAHAAARRWGPGHRPERAGRPPRRAMDRLGDDRRGHRRESRSGRRARRGRAGWRPLRGAARRERHSRLRPVLQRDRKPHPLVHPALPLGPLQRPGHPPGGGRGLGVRLQGRQRRSREGHPGGDRGRCRTPGDVP